MFLPSQFSPGKQALAVGDDGAGCCSAGFVRGTRATRNRATRGTRHERGTAKTDGAQLPEWGPAPQPREGPLDRVLASVGLSGALFDSAEGYCTWTHSSADSGAAGPSPKPPAKKPGKEKRIFPPKNISPLNGTKNRLCSPLRRCATTTTSSLTALQSQAVGRGCCCRRPMRPSALTGKKGCMCSTDSRRENRSSTPLLPPRKLPLCSHNHNTHNHFSS